MVDQLDVTLITLLPLVDVDKCIVQYSVYSDSRFLCLAFTNQTTVVVTTIYILLESE